VEKVEIVLFQEGTCDSCDVTWAILQSYAGMINGQLEGEPVALKRYTLGEGEGIIAAATMGVKSGPTFFINGEKHEGRQTGEQIFDSIASKLGLEEKKLAELRKAVLG
jgi:predicted DsbA family dithiol-disulfide isomerase